MMYQSGGSFFFSFMGYGTDSWIWGRISCIKRATWLPYPLETVVYMCIRVRASGQLWVSFSETPSPSQRWSLSLMSSSLLIRLDWLVSEPQESSYLCLHTAGIASTCQHIIQFCVCSGNQTKVLVLVNQTLSDWAIFQVPFLIFYWTISPCPWLPHVFLRLFILCLYLLPFLTADMSYPLPYPSNEIVILVIVFFSFLYILMWTFKSDLVLTPNTSLVFHITTFHFEVTRTCLFFQPLLINSTSAELGV